MRQCSVPTGGKASYHHNAQPAVMPKKNQLPPRRLDNKEFVTIKEKKCFKDFNLL
jgi:hypothetical protein